MPVQITIRNVPDATRDRIAERAASQKQSMQAFLREELERIASQASRKEVLERARRRVAITNRQIGSETIVKMIREDRDR